MYGVRATFTYIDQKTQMSQIESPESQSESQYLKLSNGTLIDAVIVPEALERWSSFESKVIFDELSRTNKQPINEEIPISIDGLDPIIVTGDHPSLHYRGNKLKRNKIWAQTNYKDGMLKYGYTGWQHAVAAATRDIVAYPSLDRLMAWLNANFAKILLDNNLPANNAIFNHAIFTRYEDENDFIGQHADKEKDFVSGSYFVVFKLGAARDFVFSETLSEKDETIFQKELPAGTMIIVKTGTANQMVKHGVPVIKRPCGASGSIVFRCIKTVVPWATVQKNIDKAKALKKKRKAVKDADAERIAKQQRVGK